MILRIVIMVFDPEQVEAFIEHFHEIGTDDQRPGWLHASGLITRYTSAEQDYYFFPLGFRGASRELPENRFFSLDLGKSKTDVSRTARGLFRT